MFYSSFSNVLLTTSWSLYLTLPTVLGFSASGVWSPNHMIIQRFPTIHEPKVNHSTAAFEIEASGHVLMRKRPRNRSFFSIGSMDPNADAAAGNLTMQDLNASRGCTENSSTNCTVADDVKKVAVKFDHMAAIIGGVAGGVGFQLLQFLLGLTVAYVYKTKVVNKLPIIQPGGNEDGSRGRDFKMGICGCFTNRSICLHSLFCFTCRAAQNWVVSVPQCGFWGGYLGLLTFGTCCGPIAIGILGMGMRGTMRHTMGYEPDNCRDFFRWCCCPACAVAQEAIDIDTETEVEVTCCCKVSGPNLLTDATGEQAEAADPAEMDV